MLHTRYGNKNRKKCVRGQEKDPSCFLTDCVCVARCVDTKDDDEETKRRRGIGGFGYGRGGARGEEETRECKRRGRAGRGKKRKKKRSGGKRSKQSFWADVIGRKKEVGDR